jgi:hypothetical protein
MLPRHLLRYSCLLMCPYLLLTLNLWTPPDSHCSGRTTFTYTYPRLRARSGLSGFAPEPEVFRQDSFYTNLWTPPDSHCSGRTIFTYTYPRLRTRSGLSGLAPEPEVFRQDSFYTNLWTPPDSHCSGRTVFTYTYPRLRTRSGLSGLAPEPEVFREDSFYTHLWTPPDSSGFSGLALESGIVMSAQFLHALINFYGLVPLGILKF